jgi:hypothetical protein
VSERVTQASVEWAYKSFLHRPADSQEVINDWISRTSTLEQLVANVVGSPEFKELAALKAARRAMLKARIRSNRAAIAALLACCFVAGATGATAATIWLAANPTWLSALR